MRCQFKPTTYMKQRMIQRGISDKEAKETIIKGAKTPESRGRIKSDHGIYTAVYKKVPCTYYGITIFIR